MSKISLLKWWNENPLADIARQYPIHLSDLPGKKVVIVATRAPKSPMSGGMAPAVKEACAGFDTKFWYAFGEDVQKKGWLTRMTLAAFNAAHNKTVPVTAFEVEGFRVRQVSAEERQWDLQYNQYCNRWVWPICHNLTQFAKDILDWDTYGNRHANEKTAKRIKQDLNGDTETPIWIHDYHHLTLASALRNNGVTNPIVYFHHIPLPKVDTLDADVSGEKNHFVKMMKSLKACDAVVFQTEEVVKRFYDLIGRESPKRIFPYQGNFISSDMNGRQSRQVFIAHAPISINTPKIMEIATDPFLRTENAKKLDEQLVAENIFINFERCDYSKGILQRVKAFEQLMIERPDLRGKAQLVLGAEPTRSDIPEYKKYAEDVNRIVAIICENKNLWIGDKPPVIFSNQNIAHDDVIRLMRNSKEGQRRIGLVTPHEDGMNLTAKEFAAAQDLENAGPLVLSSGAGAAAELALNGKGAIVYPTFINGHVNPLVTVMKQAIDMPQSESNARARVMQEHLKAYDLKRWSNWFENIFAQIQDGSLWPKQESEAAISAPPPQVLSL